MIHEEQDEEISIFDYLSILWKRKWLILIPTLVLAAAAGIVGFVITPVWEVDAIIQPGFYLFSDNAGQYRETPVSEPFRMAVQISQQSFNRLIASELKLDERRFPELFAENIKNTYFIRTWLRVTDIDRGTKILISLLQHLKAEFDGKLDMEVKRLETQIFEQENTIKDKRAEIVLLEIQKTKSLAQIASEETIIKISEERRQNISVEMASAKTRTDALEEQLKKAIETQQKGSDAISLGLLLYSSQIQSNIQYYNLLDEKMNAEKVLQENSRLKIKSTTEDSKENDAHIGILKNEIDNIGNAIKLILERKARIKYAEVIKDPSVSDHPMAPRKAMYILWGGLIGLSVFSLAALFLERRDKYRSRS
ncbi:MAG: Wzz/FepE/Etk N-terminal domain-containing protein [Candidatus Aminicenantes bacterium]|nr:Wzz/FepE/Etk N-terminal domain-containing protein [Candidatus Aminicenantes bacterium]